MTYKGTRPSYQDKLATIQGMVVWPGGEKHLLANSGWLFFFVVPIIVSPIKMDRSNLNSQVAKLLMNPVGLPTC